MQSVFLLQSVVSLKACRCIEHKAISSKEGTDGSHCCLILIGTYYRRYRTRGPRGVIVVLYFNVHLSTIIRNDRARCRIEASTFRSKVEAMRVRRRNYTSIAHLTVLWQPCKNESKIDRQMVRRLPWLVEGSLVSSRWAFHFLLFSPR